MKIMKNHSKFQYATRNVTLLINVIILEDFFYVHIENLFYFVYFYSSGISPACMIVYSPNKPVFVDPAAFINTNLRSLRKLLLLNRTNLHLL